MTGWKFFDFRDHLTGKLIRIKENWAGQEDLKLEFVDGVQSEVYETKTLRKLVQHVPGSNPAVSTFNILHLQLLLMT